MDVNEFWVLLLGLKNEKLGIRLKKKYAGTTDWGSYCKEEWLGEFLDSKDSFYNGNGCDDDDESYNENNEQQQLREGFASSCFKIVSPILLQKLINDFAVYKHFYLLKM